ncbi:MULTISPECIES: ABC transporter permease [unclassified Streptomyces]|uniref:ABC transporter permease n=1 Tax=unclassified Streptomyces TaxID=2593676 RepID=UPI001F03F213|nr:MULTISPECIES: FtsX-like permease family protein [unclassified Streptomyces]MCH0563567.1 ABC transporter permease [Streptomyces sp. MUM 2J]MCH0570951.1 ABC transporter permease [Streptomyces sp. MUM 136J]
MSVRQWSRDLSMGVRFAFGGGREGWTRALLTAVGVGLGVALLLLSTAVPNALAVRHDRDKARADHTFSQPDRPKADNTLIVADANTMFGDRDVRGRLLEPEGPRAPRPPGVDRLPRAGEMVVSPALKDLLASRDGKLLRERLPYRISGTIGEPGLVGSHELSYYAGAEGLSARLGRGSVARITAFGDTVAVTAERTDPVLIMLILVVFTVLLMPVAVFIAAAVRFGGERRDRRLAALRLVGSDSRTTRRIAAGEALGGSLLGLVLGAGFFLMARQAAGSVELMGVSAFPSYLTPSPALALLVAVAVPAASVLVTLFTLRGVVIEPLGVVRTAKPARRRLWWRLLLPLAGLAMLYPMLGQGRDNGYFNQYLVIGGVMLLLVGVTALLPWAVEAVVGRLGTGGLSWQLAVRRLQLSSGTAARTVNGIAVAVAGAIALHMLFSGVEGDYSQPTGQDLRRAQMQVSLDRGAIGAAGRFRSTEGVRSVTQLSGIDVGDRRLDPDQGVPLTIGDCTALRELAALPSCHDGDVFAVTGAEPDESWTSLARPGRTLYLDPSYEGSPGEAIAWKVPGTLRHGTSVDGLLGFRRGGLMMTPAALPPGAAERATTQLYLRLDRSVPHAEEYVRNTTAGIDPMADATLWSSTRESTRFASIRTGLFVGAACVLGLIGASLLVAQLEQLRERRKLLSSLVAFGTRRRTLSLSVLWQTAIPIALGLLLASAVGLGLGALLLRMAATPVRVDWASVLAMSGIGAGVVLAVTLLSLPPLLRLMRPEGLRTE